MAKYDAAQIHVNLDSGYGDLLCELRHRAGWTQPELAHHAGVHVNAISYIETGKAKRKRPNWDTHVRYIRALLAILSRDELKALNWSYKHAGGVWKTQLADVWRYELEALPDPLPDSPQAVHSIQLRERKETPAVSALAALSPDIELRLLKRIREVIEEELRGDCAPSASARI